jgi:tetratricopeptide (TPR) repeat protein
VGAVVTVLRAHFGAKDKRGAQAAFDEADKIDTDPKRYEQAEELYRKAIRLNPSLANARTNLGNVRYRRGDRDSALRHWQDALRVDPQQPEAYYNTGVAYLDNSEPRRAIPFFQTALGIVPKDELRLAADIHYNLASAFDELGYLDNARVHWKKHIELAPDSESAKYARTFLANTGRLVSIRGGKA